MFRNQKILITGANGKIGTAICDVLEKNEGYDIIKFTHGNDLLEKNDNEYKGNLFISDHIKHVFNDHDIDIVIHLAVSRNPMSNPRIRSYETFEKDTIILFNLLSCCDNISKFIFSSSAAVYGHAYFKDVVSRKDVAQKIFYLGAEAPEFGYLDDEFSGFYNLTTESNPADVSKSGVKYFSESYDLQNLNCTFSKRVKLDHKLKENYSVDITHSLTMDDEGYVNVSENGKIKSTKNKAFADRYNDVELALESEIDNAKDRCETVYDSYRNVGLIDPDYRGTNTGSTAYDNESNLFDKPISVGRTYQPTIAEASYSVAFTNNKHTYEANGIHEFTQSVTESRDGIVNVSLNGSFTKYYPNKFGGYNWKTNIYDQLKTSFDTKAEQTYNYYKSKQIRSYKERSKTTLPVTAYRGGLVNPSLAIVSSSVTLPKYGPKIEYSNEYTDDPAILKSGPLYNLDFRKFTINTNDVMMKPINNSYVIAGKKYQIVHDSTQTDMGSRSFSIEGFIKRPSSNTLTTPTAWNIGPKLEAVKDEISQIMANIISDAQLKKTSKALIGDIFVQDVSFSLDSKGNFSVSGNIPFIAQGGEKHDTVGRIM